MIENGDDLTGRTENLAGRITRRELLHSSGIAASATLAASLGPAAPTGAQPSLQISTDADYPPTWQGLRGQTDSDLAVAHAMRDGARFDEATDTGEIYDLIVVGAGSSGLAAAYFFRKEFPSAKILILDNCDDFGGHARRNEFMIDGRQVLHAGGSFTLMYPETFTSAGKALLSDIGVDRPRFYAALEATRIRSPERRLSQAAFFDRENYGVDKLVTGFPGSYNRDPAQGNQKAQWVSFLQRAPLSALAREGLLRVATEQRDYMAGITIDEKIRRLRTMSYADYLSKIAKLPPDAVKFVHNEQGFHFNVGAGADSFSAWFARTAEAIGFQGLGLPPIPFPDESTKVHFPDGNAGVMRLLVRNLIPEALPGSTMEDSVARRVDYRQLDRNDAPIRLRLNSTVVHAAHIGDPARAEQVRITYVAAGRARHVRGSACVMACFNAVIPYLCPELPAAQKEALQMAVRKPLLIAGVALRNWRPFARSGAGFILSSTSFYQMTSIETGLNIGAYRASETPDEPAIVSLYQYPEHPGLPARDQYRAARADMLATNMEDYKAKATEQLSRMLSGTGFDPARDIAGVMINRWGHGYACGGNELYDPDWANEDAPWVKGRRRFGRIAIANSDASGISMMQAAFDQADRAVRELIQDVIRPSFYNLNPERG